MPTEALGARNAPADDNEPAPPMPPAAAPAARRRRPLVKRGPNSGTQDALLKAAGELLDEEGYEGLSTTAIAHRAGVSTATVYRHYPDKHAVLIALCYYLHREHIESALQCTDAVGSAPDWRAATAAAIRELYALRTRRPGGNSIQIALQASPELARFNQEMNDELTQMLARALRRRRPDMRQATAARVALVCVTSLLAILEVIARKPSQARALLNEAIRQRQAHLAQYLD